MNTITRIIITMAVIGIGLAEGKSWIDQLENIQAIQPNLFTMNIMALVQVPMLGVGLLYLVLNTAHKTADQLLARPIMAASSMLSNRKPSSPPQPPPPKGDMNIQYGSSSSQNGSSRGASGASSSQIAIRRGPPRW